MNIHIVRKNVRGELSLHWDISYSEKYGDARQLAYRLDTLVINRRIHEYGRPVPKAIYLGSLRSIAQELGLKRDTNKLKRHSSKTLLPVFQPISTILQRTAPRKSFREPLPATKYGFTGTNSQMGANLTPCTSCSMIVIERS